MSQSFSDVLNLLIDAAEFYEQTRSSTQPYFNIPMATNRYFTGVNNQDYNVKLEAPNVKTWPKDMLSEYYSELERVLKTNEAYDFRASAATASLGVNSGDDKVIFTSYATTAQGLAHDHALGIKLLLAETAKDVTWVEVFPEHENLPAVDSDGAVGALEAGSGQTAGLHALPDDGRSCEENGNGRVPERLSEEGENTGRKRIECDMEGLMQNIAILAQNFDPQKASSFIGDMIMGLMDSFAPLIAQTRKIDEHEPEKLTVQSTPVLNVEDMLKFIDALLVKIYLLPELAEGMLLEVNEGTKQAAISAGDSLEKTAPVMILAENDNGVISDASGSAPINQGPTTEERTKIMESIEGLKGTPYPPAEGGLDCSHAVHEAYKNAGLDYEYLTSRAFPGKYFIEISEDELQPGDIVHWPGHVSIYKEGTGQDMIVIGARRPGKLLSETPARYFDDHGSRTYYRLVR